jgi:ring-1,2-phenylacetyl-CoA epoxidase subunit PaaC
MTDETVPGPDSLTDDERAALEALLFTVADDEFVAAERYVDWQVRGPTLEADIAIANVAQDEYGHARLWYGLLEDLGYEESALIWERPPEEFRHATMLERPFEAGDWADCVVRGYLYDTYERLSLESLRESRYAPLADRVEKVLGEEHYHRDHAQNWLERLAGDPDGRDRCQAALDSLYPHALTLFETTSHEDAILDAGFRSEPRSETRDDWVAVTTPFLSGLGLTVPDLEDVELPTDATGRPVRGRDGTHTSAWVDLADEFRYTYEMLDHEPAKLMADPEVADD